MTAQKEPGSDSIVTVIIAFAANLLIAIAKTAAAVITGSASLVAEAAHSWADAGNEVFLLIAERRSVRASDPAHPLGYGRAAYVWSMYAAFGLFAVGSAVSVMHGVQSMFEPEAATGFVIAYVVLGIAFILEGFSFLQAFRQVRKRARSRGQNTLEHVLASSNPTLRAVFAEDSAALIGLALAFGGILLHQLTGSPVYDAVGSILVGVLLGVVAVILIERNARFLIAKTRRAVLTQLLERPEIDRITYLHLEYVGPERLYLVAAVDLVGNSTESPVALDLRAIEQQISENPHIAQAVLTLSAPTDPALALR